MPYNLNPSIRNKLPTTPHLDLIRTVNLPVARGAFHLFQRPAIPRMSGVPFNRHK